MSLKVALCLSGMPRDIHLTWPFFQKNLLSHYEVDIFGAFWTDPLNKDNHNEFPDRIHSHFTESEFINLCSPKVSKFIEFNHIFHDKLNEINYKKLGLVGIEPIKNYHSLCMFFMIEQADRLRREYEKLLDRYDVVIRCRPDLYLENIPNLHNLNEKTVYMSKYITLPGFNDTCWWSTSNTANLFTDLFTFFSQFDFSQIQTKILEPEHIIQIYLQINKIQLSWTDDQQIITRFKK